MWLLRNCRGGRSCAPLHAGRLEAARLKHLAAEALRAGGAVVRLEPRPFAGSSARPDVEAVGSSGHPHYVDVGRHLRAAKGAGRPQPPNTTFSAVVFDVFGSSVGRGVAEEDGGATRRTALGCVCDSRRRSARWSQRWRWRRTCGCRRSHPASRVTWRCPTPGEF
jgi:hypothetical protein